MRQVYGTDDPAALTGEQADDLASQSRAALAAVSGPDAASDSSGKKPASGAARPAQPVRRSPTRKGTATNSADGA
jgi:hypothetical protein